MWRTKPSRLKYFSTCKTLGKQSGGNRQVQENISYRYLRELQCSHCFRYPTFLYSSVIFCKTFFFFCTEKLFYHGVSYGNNYLNKSVSFIKKQTLETVCNGAIQIAFS